MAELKTFTITLAGQVYTVRSDEDVRLLEKAAQTVDSFLKESVAKAPSLLPEKQALFAAFALAQRLCKLEMQQQEDSASVQRMICMVDSTLSSEL